jgi:hypothetical protein
LSYAGPVDEFDFPAYAKRLSLGMAVIFCNGDQPFEVFVDIYPGDDLAAVVAVAKLVLNG